ncbi:MAG: hypothetical protein DRG59_04540 [Deltaproteobacteria bacterium]|nr:MAG: hypothetical protein DRG59_04540 [Deltaproteobacteria bacterium]
MKPVVSVGWVLLSDVVDAQLLQKYESAISKLRSILEENFSQFTWELPFVRRWRYPPHGALDPLELLEAGLQEKTKNGWDYSIVLVSNELRPRYRISTIGVPSSALEVAVLSSSELNNDGIDEKIAALALHLLGHLWGLSHSEDGPMVPPEDYKTLTLCNFTDGQKELIEQRLVEASDARLEERQAKWGHISFYWSTFWTDPKGILRDVHDYSPWRLPLKMAKMTAATAVSMIFVLMGSESWELGAHFSPLVLLIGTLLAVLGSTSFIFAGQNLGQISREVGYREQLARTKIVVFTTLLYGMFFLWLLYMIFVIGMGILFPREILDNWLGGRLSFSELLHFASFAGILGLLAGAVGGNLEEEDEIKAELFYDEET